MTTVFEREIERGTGVPYPHCRCCSKKAAHFCAAENLISGQIAEALLPYQTVEFGIEF